MKTHPFQSIRWRLQLWHGLLLFAALVALWFAALYLAVERRRLQADERVAAAMSGLMPAVNARTIDAKTARDLRLPERVRAQFGPPEDGLCYFLVWHSDGTVLARSEHAGTAPPETSAWPAVATSETGPREETRTSGTRRERLRQTVRGLYVLVGTDTARDTAAALRETAKLGFVAVIVLALNLAGGWWIVGRALRPVVAITRTANMIADGDLSERINTRDTASELGALAQVLNRTFSRLQESFARQARFTADASHELRTPVAVILAESRGTLSRPRDPAAYQDALNVCAETAAGMGKLIDALLQLARLDSGEHLPQRTRTALAPLIATAIEPLRTGRVQLTTALDEVHALVDPDLMRQVVVNLVCNAIEYTPDGGTVSLELRGGDLDTPALLRISDTGCGIPPEHLPHLFDRFHRVDPARTDRHFGLGLSIVKAIADAHGATLEIQSTPGLGSTCTLRIPAAAGRIDRREMAGKFT